MIKEVGQAIGNETIIIVFWVAGSRLSDHGSDVDWVTNITNYINSYLPYSLIDEGLKKESAIPIQLYEAFKLVRYQPGKLMSA